MQVDQEERKNNVLFEPEIYRNFELDQDESASDVTTIAAGSKFGGVAVSDPKLLVAQKIRCCVCGVMTEPNAANTCIHCLKSQIDITEGITRNG